VITVCLVDVRGDKARIGIQADNSIFVHREEVQDAIDREKKRANCTAA
jgi:carbon storage regulator